MPFLWLLLARLGELRGAPWAEGFRFGPRVMTYAQSLWHDRRYRNRRFLDGPVFDLSVGSARRRRVVRSGRMSTAPSGIFAAREFRSDYGFGATACWCGAAPEGPATRPGPSMDTVVQPGNLKKALARVGRNVSGATRGHPASTA